MRSSLFFAALTILTTSTILTGCRGRVAKQATPLPRPVSVMRAKADLKSSDQLSAVVGSWKVEDIGFEVDGRVQFVIEPESNVAGYLTGAEGGPVIARIDPTRYKTQETSAIARVSMLEKQKKVAQIELDEVLKADREAAEATRKLAQTEHERSGKLLERGAIPQAKFDEIDANLKSAVAGLAQVDAKKAAKAAEVLSIQAQIDQAEAALSDAQRDVADCELRSPFRGQVAEVHVIPGGYVQRGEPVLTVQMMDPVKVEFEVSSQRARGLKYKNAIDVTLFQPDGGSVTREGIIYQTGATADPNTRTFTITVLVRNEKVTAQPPPNVDRKSLAKTRDTWKFVRGILDDDSYYVEENSVHSEGDGDYVYKIVTPNGARRPEGSLLKIEKVRVKAGNIRTSFLGLWWFRDVSLPEGSEFDPENDLIIGKLDLPEGVSEPGEQVLFERDRWLLRPGDLVQVDLESSVDKGVYVPINAIKESSGKHSLFVVEEEAGQTQARRVDVNVSAGPDAWNRVEPTAGGDLPADAQIIVGGVHYLVDGEAVQVVGQARVDQ